jgi:MFS family permease
VPSFFTPLRHASFRRLWIGQVLSSVGSAMFPVALAVTVLRQGRDPSELGVVLGAEMAAYVIVVLLGGVLADRFRRTRVMIGSDLASALALSGFAIIGLHAPLPALVALATMVGLASAFFQPAYSALMPHVVPAAELQAANALRGASQRLAAVVGPAIAGALVVWVGPSAAFAVDAVSYGVSAALLFGLPEPRRVREVSETVLMEAVGGLRAVWERRWIAVVVLQGTAQLLLALGPMLVLVPIVLHQRGQDEAYALVAAGQALGAVLGGVQAARIRPAEPGTLALLVLLGSVGELACLAIEVPVALFVVASVVTGFGFALFGALWFTALQRHVPDGLLARVFAVEQLGTFALAPLAYVVAPLVAGRVGVEVLAWLGVATMLISTVVLLPVRDIRRFGPEAPPAVQPQPEPEPDHPAAAPAPAT